MRTPYLLFVVALLCLAAFPALAADVKIIANSGVSASTISADDLKGIFLATKSALADGARVEPVLAKSGAAHEAFVKQYLGKTDAALQTYYRSLVFSGKGSMPKELASDAEMVAYVAKTKGAIGYVSSGASTAGVKVLEIQ
jgi:hypothetical protein